MGNAPAVVPAAAAAAAAAAAGVAAAVAGAGVGVVCCCIAVSDRALRASQVLLRPVRSIITAS